MAEHEEVPRPVGETQRVELVWALRAILHLERVDGEAVAHMAGIKFPGGVSSLCGLGLGLKFPGNVCLGDMELAAPLRDLLGRRDLRCGVVVWLLLLWEREVPPGVEQALQSKAVSTAAVGPEADVAQQVSLEHKRIGRHTKVFQ